MPTLVIERIESVKAGIVSAGAFAIAELTIVLLEIVLFNFWRQLDLTPIVFNWELMLQLLFGAISGFLFGVTYRYIIRDDRNSHLNDGAVFAFGLIRGLALIENSLIWSEILSLLFLITQSIVCFAIARLILDLAISRKLIKPFI